MKKYLFIILFSCLAIALIIGMFLWHREKQSPEDASPEYEEITMVIPTQGFVPEDFDRIADALNDISIRQCGVKVNYLFTNISEMNYVCRFRLNAGESIDLMPCIEGSNLQDYINDQMLAPLDLLLDEYAPEIRNLFYPKLWDALRFDGKIYALTALGAQSDWCGFYLRSDAMEAAGLDADALLQEFQTAGGSVLDRTDQVFSPLLKSIHNSDAVLPDGSRLSDKKLIPANNDYQGVFSQFFLIDAEDFGNRFGVVLQDTPQIVNLYETGEYLQKANLIRKWKEAGYIYNRQNSSDSNMNVLFHGAQSFGIFTSLGVSDLDPSHPVMVNQDIYIPLANEKCTAEKIQIGTWVIPSSSVHKEAAMKILNLMYTDEAYVRTYFFGPSASPDTGNPDNGSTGITWIFGNTLLSARDYPEAAEKVYKTYDALRFSPFFGFSYDGTQYESILQQLQSIADEYLPALETGSCEDPEAALAEMNRRLYDAGLQTILDDKQQQLDDWLAEKP